MQAEFSGEIGPFLDTVQQRQVSVVVLAHCKFARMNAAGSDAELGQQVQQQMLRAIHEAIAPKMEAGQLAFKDLGMGNVAALMPEIVARSGLAQMGIAVGNLSMHFGIDGRAPQPFAAPAPAPAPAPQQVNMRVGGFNVHASSDGGIDTAGLKNQMVDKVKSTLLWWAFGIGITLFILVALGGYGYYVWKHPPAPAPMPAAAAAAVSAARQHAAPGHH